VFSKNGSIDHVLLHRCLTGDLPYWDGEGRQGTKYTEITKEVYCTAQVFPAVLARISFIRWRVWAGNPGYDLILSHISLTLCNNEKSKGKVNPKRLVG